eukprot:11803560-Karenia_brevis.AAC.1
MENKMDGRSCPAVENPSNMILALEMVINRRYNQNRGSTLMDQITVNLLKGISTAAEKCSIRNSLPCSR